MFGLAVSGSVTHVRVCVVFTGEFKRNCSTSVYVYMCFAETKNVAVYLCKGDFTGNSDRHELTIMKGDHVSVLDKTDAGMSHNIIQRYTYINTVYTCIYVYMHTRIHTYLVRVFQSCLIS